jgi:hypothetical protein
VEIVTGPEAVGVNVHTSSGAPPPPQDAERVEAPLVEPLTRLTSGGMSLGVAQLPQVAAQVVVRFVPQLSFAVTVPHPPTRAQNAASLSGVQAQRLSMPQAPPIGQVPQLTDRGRPQRSFPFTAPQFF